MKNKILLVLFAGLLFSACSRKQPEIIADIKKEQEAIDKELSKYSLRQAEDIISKDKGVVTGYFDEEQPKKISTQNFGQLNRIFRDYYFDHGMLVYMVEQKFIYNQSNLYTEEVAKAAGDSVWYDDSKTRMEVNSYYLDDNRLIKWVGKDGRDVAIQSAEFVNAQSEVLTQALYALKQLKSE